MYVVISGHKSSDACFFISACVEVNVFKRHKIAVQKNLKFWICCTDESPWDADTLMSAAKSDTPLVMHACITSVCLVLIINLGFGKWFSICHMFFGICRCVLFFFNCQKCKDFSSPGEALNGSVLPVTGVLLENKYSAFLCLSNL